MLCRTAAGVVPKGVEADRYIGSHPGTVCEARGLGAATCEAHNGNEGIAGVSLMHGTQRSRAAQQSSSALEFMSGVLQNERRMRQGSKTRTVRPV